MVELVTGVLGLPSSPLAGVFNSPVGHRRLAVLFIATREGGGPTMLTALPHVPVVDTEWPDVADGAKVLIFWGCLGAMGLPGTIEEEGLMM